MGQARKDRTFLTRFVRKLRGGTQSILAEASDGHLYIVKFINNLQGPNVPFNEAMGTALFEMCGFLVAPWTPITVTEGFIDDNRLCWLETPEGRVRPKAGVCFGSQFLGAPSCTLYEILPGNYFKRVRNHFDFWLAWLVDVCAGHMDNRQAIFRDNADRTLTAFFIDYGHMFGGPMGDGIPRIATSRYLDLRIYEGFSAKSMNPKRILAEKLNTERLWDLALALPDEWKNGSALTKFTDCLNRLSDSRFVQDVYNSIIDNYRHSSAGGVSYKDNGTSTFAILHPRILPTRVRGETAQ